MVLKHAWSGRWNGADGATRFHMAILILSPTTQIRVAVKRSGALSKEDKRLLC